MHLCTSSDSFSLFPHTNGCGIYSIRKKYLISSVKHEWESVRTKFRQLFSKLFFDAATVGLKYID